MLKLGGFCYNKYMKFLKVIIILVILGAAGFWGYRYWSRIDAGRPGVQPAGKREKSVNLLPAADPGAQALQEQTDRYNQCLNQAYRDYQARYSEECGQVVIDGECRLNQQQLSDIQSYYVYDKTACEKLKP